MCKALVTVSCTQEELSKANDHYFTMNNCFICSLPKEVITLCGITFFPLFEDFMGGMFALKIVILAQTVWLSG